MQKKNQRLFLLFLQKIEPLCEHQTWNISRVSDLIKGMGMLYWNLQVDVVLSSFTKTSQMLYFKPSLDIWFCEQLLTFRLIAFPSHSIEEFIYASAVWWDLDLSIILSLRSSPKLFCGFKAHPRCLAIALCPTADLRRPRGSRRGLC